ncbi:origin recognition complex subunit 3 [Huso huso]|uniref:Origin recognition complex subunit 3 n=1 Tax=Huso huso TaxID=61971 RepID=A0ABR0ZUD6_HUSHU
MTTSSVSKGCFVFKPSSKKKKTTSLKASDYFHDGKADSQNSESRFETFQSLWQRMKAETERVQEDLNTNILDSLLEFARKSTASFQSKTDDWASRMRASEIPTAALVLGVNVPDHAMTFQSLSALLQESVTPYVVCLQSKECSALKQVLQKVLVQLMGHSVSVEDDDDEEDQPGPRPTGIPSRKMLCSMATLCGWYTAVTQKSASPSPGKKRLSSSKGCGQRPPVVVIFKDLESFTPRVLQEFIVISSQYIQQLPLIFIFGIATSPITIHGMLPHSVSSLLCIQLFQSLSCTQHLATVIDKLVLTTTFPFKLSGKVLQVLISIFLYHDFSVRNFIKGLQLSLLDHFYSQPLSMLCCDKQEARSRAKELSHEDCENIRQLPSFMRYVEKQEPEIQIQLLTSDQRVKDVTQSLLKELHAYHKNYYPVLRCLHALTSSLPKYPLGKQIRELHGICLEKNVWETEEYESAFQLLRMLAKDELVAVLRTCTEILKCAKKLGDAVEKLEEFIERFELLDRCSAVVETGQEGEEELPPQKGLQKKTDLFQLQKSLLERESRRTKKLSKFELLRLAVLDCIDSIVKKHLLPPESQPLHEVFYYSSAGTLRRHLNAAPRTAIQTALNNPYCYLQSEALKSEGGAISNAAPDICIVYKLHLECGRLINLYDWLEAYATVVAAAEGKDPDSAAAAQLDDVKHARFIRAVSELEFLGFIKPTKQKTDHVARLTWGGC